MSLDTTNQNNSERIYPFQIPEIRKKAHAANAEWRRQNPVQVAINTKKALAAANAARKAKAMKKQTKQAGSAKKMTLSVTAETLARFKEFQNGAVSTNTALNMLLDLAGNKKVVAKPTAVIYSVE